MIDKKILLDMKRTLEGQWARCKGYKETRVETCPMCDNKESDCMLCNGNIKSMDKMFQVFNQDRKDIVRDIKIFNRDLEEAGIDIIKIDDVNVLEGVK